MTRKNYVAIAEIVRNVMGESHLLTPLVNTLSNYFKDENEKFSPSLFKSACLNGGLKESVDTDVPKKKVTPVKAILHPKSPPIMTSNVDVDTILEGADATMERFTEGARKIAEAHRKKQKS